MNVDKKVLMEKVIEQIKSDLHYHETCAIEELLAVVPIKNLMAFLSEADAQYVKDQSEENEDA